MGELVNLFLTKKPDWSGVGSIGIWPVWSAGDNRRRLGYRISVNGEANDKVYAFLHARDAVDAAVLEWAGEWPPEVDHETE